ncbi:MAG TPA: cation diffusion facilitator family transporter [Bryobacteraceae bacterium]|nr:cation diffusion facilitator family transporter [Bryobacteraceae bacterium]
MTASVRIGRRVALTSMFVSAALAAAKITVGLKANSTAAVSDGIESAGDILASGLVLFGLIMASKPPDAEHPYGHGRLETISGLGVGMFLAAMGVLISAESLRRAAQTDTPPQFFAVWPLAASIVVKTIMFISKRHFGRRLESSGLIADAWNDAMDTLSGTVALLGVGLAVLNPATFRSADDWGGFGVGIVIVVLALRIVRDTTFQLMDTMPDQSRMQQIRAVALTVPGALGIEKCFARKTGLQYHVDLHLEVDPAMSVLSSHEIATDVRFKIKEKLPWVADVLVHVEPHMLATIADRQHGKS